MDDFIKPGDHAVIYFYAAQRPEAKKLKARILRQDLVPNERLTLSLIKDGPAWQGVGFRIWDAASQEELTYNFRSGTYNTLRAKAALRLFRDANQER